MYYDPQSGNQAESIKLPAITATNVYYVKVAPINVPNYALSTYRIVIEPYIGTATVNAILSPASLTSASNVWSSDALYNASSLPATAVITSATIQASPGTTANATANKLRVKIANGSYTPEISWSPSSGAIAIPSLVGQNCVGIWSAGFKATEISVIVSGKLTKIGLVSMKDLRLAVTYEYEKF